jgi:hypothetical protein
VTTRPPIVNTDPGTRNSRDIPQNDASLGKAALAVTNDITVGTLLTPSARIARLSIKSVKLYITD